MDNLTPPNTIQKTSIEGVFLINRPVFPDDRGSFQEVVRIPDLENAVGHEIQIKQINKSINKKGVLRGLHIAPWGKLVHCYFGNAFQVVVDVRKKSSTYGEVFTCLMGENNSQAIWVPPFCANGFCVPDSGIAVYSYSVTQTYELGKEVGLAWNDPEIFSKINWPLTNPIVSAKDQTGVAFKDLPDFVL